METNCQKLIDKSEENWNLAMDLCSGGKYNAAANRFYYSIFQVVKVYAIKKGKMKLEDRKGVHGIAKDLVKSEDKKLGRIYGDAENYRATADYLLEDVSKNDLDSTFINDVQTLRDHYKRACA